MAHGELIAQRRRTHRLTREEFARRLRVDVEHVQAIEEGRTPLKVRVDQTLLVLGERLGEDGQSVERIQTLHSDSDAALPPSPD
jgi:transcriptional regulator with XRE-family HTH domain